MKKMFARKYLIIAVIFLVFFLKAWLQLDPDFGWHYQMGKLILAHGIPKTDPFSYTMPSFPFVDHEWFAEVFIAVVFPLLGMVGLAILFAALVVSSLWFSLLTLKAQLLQRFEGFLMLGTASIMPLFGVRIQILSWFFFSCLLFLVADSTRWRRWRFFIPFLFILWVNIHAGFAVGNVALFFVFIAAYFSKEWKRENSGVIFLLSTVATLLNPYGIKIWQTVFETVTSPLLKSSILEWRSPLLGPIYTYSLLFLGTLACILLFRYKEKFSFFQIICFFFFMLASAASVRNIPLFIIVGLPCVIGGFSFFTQDVRKQKDGEKRLVAAYRVLFWLMLFVATVDVSLSLYGAEKLGEGVFYPQKAMIFLRNHPSSGQMLTTYDWGGYIMWQLPGEKVFADGMMPVSQWHAPKKESNYAYQDYLHLLSGALPLTRVIQKYHIRTILLPISAIQPVRQLEQNLVGKLITLITTLYTPKNEYEILGREAIQQKWQRVYQDETSVIYRSI